MDAANKERMRLVQVKRLEAVLKQPENRECFDCTALQPRWASTNLGIFLCMRCAGIHRSLGTHITKVKSISMDVWDEHMIVNCETIGNGGGRGIYEARLPAGYVKPSATADTHMVERVTREKFERKAWYADAVPPMGVLQPAQPVHAPGHIHANAHTPGHHGHAPTPGHVVQGSVISPGAHGAPAPTAGVVIAASAGGATISKRAPPPAQGVVIAGSVVTPAAAPPPNPPAPAPAPAQTATGGALSFFDTIATPPRAQQQGQPCQQQAAASKVTCQPDWGDFFGSASSAPSSTTGPSPVVSASSQSPFFPTPQQQPPRSTAPVDMFDPFASAPPKAATSMPTFSYATTTTNAPVGTTTGYYTSSSPQSQPPQQRGGFGGSSDPFSQLSAGAMHQFASAPAAPRAAAPVAVFAAPPATRNAIDDLFS